jgi:hypothetical protein
MAYLVLGDLEKVPALKVNLTADDNTRGIGDKTHKRKSAHAFATSTLTNQTYALSLIKVIRHPINRS